MDLVLTGCFWRYLRSPDFLSLPDSKRNPIQESADPCTGDDLHCHGAHRTLIVRLNETNPEPIPASAARASASGTCVHAFVELHHDILRKRKDLLFRWHYWPPRIVRCLRFILIDSRNQSEKESLSISKNRNHYRIGSRDSHGCLRDLFFPLDCAGCISISRLLSLWFTCSRWHLEHRIINQKMTEQNQLPT